VCGCDDGTDQIDAVIVDQHVDRASAATHDFNTSHDRSLISNIERHELDIRERTCRCGCADTVSVAPGGQQLGSCPPDAGRCTCDQDNMPRSVRHET
jgi:hypothetical protein